MPMVKKLDCPVESCRDWKDGHCTDDNVVACYNRTKAKGSVKPSKPEEEGTLENTNSTDARKDY